MTDYNRDTQEFGTSPERRTDEHNPTSTQGTFGPTETNTSTRLAGSDDSNTDNIRKGLHDDDAARRGHGIGAGPFHPSAHQGDVGRDSSLTGALGTDTYATDTGPTGQGYDSSRYPGTATGDDYGRKDDTGTFGDKTGRTSKVSSGLDTTGSDTYGSTARGGRGNDDVLAAKHVDTTRDKSTVGSTGHRDVLGGKHGVYDTDTNRNTDTGKPSVGDKIKGGVEKLTGSVTRNPELKERGAERQAGEYSTESTKY